MIDIISAGIVLYNPNIERLEENIKNIYPQVRKLFLVDNNSENFREIIKVIEGYSKITLIRNNENYGIAKALNQIMEAADQAGFEWNLLLDQDSVVPHTYIKSFQSACSYFHLQNTAILCPLIDDINSNNNKKRQNSKYQNITFCITSGSINNVKIWKKIGKFDEKIFIDGVDQDFCIRLVKRNYKIVRLNEVSIKHEIGKIKSINLLGLKIESFNHSPFRKYYIARNIFYLDIKHKGRVVPSTIARFIKQVSLVILIDDNKLAKIKALFAGMWEGIKMKKINF